MLNISKEYFNERLEKYKLIASVKDPKSIDKAIEYKDNISSVMLLTGNILSISGLCPTFSQQWVACDRRCRKNRRIKDGLLWD